MNEDNDLGEAKTPKFESKEFFQTVLLMFNQLKLTT